MSRETIEVAGLQAPGGSGAMFDAIAPRYDLLNRLLSLGLDRSWRSTALARLRLRDGEHLLDLATGTGDVALQAAQRRPGLRVTGVDPSAGMLERAREKATRAGLLERVTFQLGDAQALPFPDATFDAATIAFGIRNVPDRSLGLRELARVLKPGGRLAILELGEPDAPLIGAAARLYVHAIVPRVGAFLSGAAEYRYLERSIAAFPPAPLFTRRIAEAGFPDARATALLFGACTLYEGTRP